MKITGKQDFIIFIPVSKYFYSMHKLARLSILFFSWLPLVVQSQYIPIHPSSPVYSFLDELAAEGRSVIPTAIRPLSRSEVALILQNTDTLGLSARQQKERTFYLADFGKELHPGKNFDRRTDLLYYRDSSFAFTLNPVGGANLWTGKDGTSWHLFNGAKAFASWGNWGFYATLFDNHENRLLTQPAFLNQNPAGSPFKIMSDSSVQYEEMKGGITYSWKGGSLGLIKDNFSWGSSYHGQNIYSGRTPSFAHLSLKLNPVPWFRFSYVHGWLNSMVTDSSRSFTYPTPNNLRYRKVYHPKFMAANMFSFRPVEGLWLSAGNSIIYDYETAHPAYFIPVMFFKAVDHSLNTGIDNMNSQMFFDLSSTLLKHTHLYATLFIDELAMKRIIQKDEYNFYSFKAGIRLFNLPPNAWAGVEYTISNALTFRHYIPTLTFESNGFNLGHFMGDNTRELVLTAGYKPARGMDASITYTRADKGPDHTALGTPRLGIKPFTPILWEKDELILSFSWQIINDLSLSASWIHSNIRGDETLLNTWTPSFWQGRKDMLRLGIAVGY